MAIPATKVRLHAPCAWLGDGFVDDVTIEVDGAGFIAAVTPGRTPGSVALAGPVVPGMPNLHSHAFQRAMAGLTQRAGPAGDDFWSWREVMYRFAQRLGPEDIAAITAQLGVELLQHGFTTLGEFHYLHHDPAGQPYADPSELAERVVWGAFQAGIGLTLLPVLYQSGGFGGVPPAPGQRRFILSVDDCLSMMDHLRLCHPHIQVGIAPHSLRAVAPDPLRDAIAGITALDPAAPIHIHIAEQRPEVAGCESWSGQRPVAWLLDHAPVDARWCLVHATHTTPGELAGMAASGAVVGLCPTTEADLGDGVFDLPGFLAAGGAFGIGTDSNVCTDPADELRLLEWGQRLARTARVVAERRQGASVGAALFARALAGGAQALGQRIGAIAPGCRADLVVLDDQHPALVGRTGDALLDAWVFSGPSTPVRDVFVGGRQIIDQGRHAGGENILDRFRASMRRLAS